jgi:hypothetical protein
MDSVILSGIENSARMLVLEMLMLGRGRGRVDRGGLRWGTGVEFSMEVSGMGVGGWLADLR